MNGKSHLLIISLILIGLWIIFGIYLEKDYFTISIILPAIVITLFPDLDQRFSMFGHRSIITHNIGIWILIFLFNQSFLFILFIFSTGVHCLADCRFCTRKRVGFYTVKVWMYPSLSIFDKENKQNIVVWKTLFGLNGGWSTIWLVGNFVCSLIIFGWWVWLM